MEFFEIERHLSGFYFLDVKQVTNEVCQPFIFLIDNAEEFLLLLVYWASIAVKHYGNVALYACERRSQLMRDCAYKVRLYPVEARQLLVSVFQVFRGNLYSFFQKFVEVFYFFVQFRVFYCNRCLLGKGRGKQQVIFVKRVKPVAFNVKNAYNRFPILYWHCQFRLYL